MKNILGTVSSIDSFEQQDKKTTLYKWLIVLGVFLLFLFLLFVFMINTYIPKNFPIGTYLSVEKGASLKNVSEILENKGYISSANFFYYRARVQGVPGVISGEYYFKDKESISSITKRLVFGEFGYKPIVMVIPEGFTREQIAELCEKKLSFCKKEEFLMETLDLEGYLFPATYTFVPNTTTLEVVEKMKSTFKEKISLIKNEFNNQTLSQKEIIILASILEREARGYEEQRIVAGILYRRLHENIPLQVDAPFYFLYGKKSSDLSLSDLRADTPYNTYINKGLTPTPIGNPGIDAIRAALNPIDSPYYFYLHGNDGVIHYAETYVEHLQNKKLYIK